VRSLARPEGSSGRVGMPVRKSVAPQYRDRAAECLLQAASATDPAVKASLEELARQWTRLAEHRERIEKPED
jgi:hypothetical protein